MDDYDDDEMGDNNEQQASQPAQQPSSNGDGQPNSGGTDADMEAAKRGIDIFGQGSRAGPPSITPGGQPGQGDPASDRRSRYTAQFPGGHQMEVVGGGFGSDATDQAAGYGHPMPPPGPGQVPLTRAEGMRLQKLQNAMNATQEAVASGSLSEGEGQRLLRRINGQMGPLQKRQDQSAIAQIMSQHKQAQTQLGLQDGLQGEHDQHLAKTIPNKIGMVPDASGNAVEYYHDHKGDLQPTPRQKHLWELEKVQAQHAAKSDPQELQAKHEERQRQAEEHERKDFENVYKTLTKKGKDDNGNAIETPPSHDEVFQHIAQRDLRMAEGKGPQAYAATVLKHYPDASKAPDEVKIKLWKIAHPGQEFKGLSSFQQ